MFFNNPWSHVKYISTSWGKGVYDDRTKQAYIIGERDGLQAPQNRKGQIYQGDWNYRNNQRHGNGKFTSNYGDIYDGEWKNDLMHGFGKIKYSYFTMFSDNYRGIESYEGEWKEGYYHGKGVALCGNDTIHGNWNFGYLYGEVKIDFFNGDRFEGVVDFDYSDIMTYANGDVFEGSLRKVGRRHLTDVRREGNGLLTHKKDGKIEQGYFSRDQLEFENDFDIEKFRQKVKDAKPYLESLN